MFLTRRYFRLLFQEAYIDFDKKVGSGLIFLTVAFCLAFSNISLMFDGIFTSFCIRNAFSSLMSKRSSPVICSGRLFPFFVTPTLP